MAKKILCVDDEPAILKTLEKRLKNQGYDVLTGNCGDDALERLQDNKFDLIILDVDMPPPNGFQLCRQLKDDPDYQATPIMLLTARGTEGDQFWGMESGADMYLTKPYSHEELLEKVGTLLS